MNKTPEEIIKKNCTFDKSDLRFASVKYYAESGSLSGSLYQAIKDSILEYASQSTTPQVEVREVWVEVPVTEDCPKKTGKYKAIDKDGEIHTMIFNSSLGKWFWLSGAETGNEFITSWLSKQTIPASPVAGFQNRVADWMTECFTPEITKDIVERNHRFLEESLELVQSLGCTSSEAHQLVDYVFNRPVGEPYQEVGGVMVTLAALCNAAGLQMMDNGETELSRISTPEIIEKIRLKQSAKPKHSPLPQSTPVASGYTIEQVASEAWDASVRFFYSDGISELNKQTYLSSIKPVAEGWVSVGKPPKESQEVIVYFKNDVGWHITAAYWNGETFTELCEVCGNRTPFTYKTPVTHWQPLPPPPQSIT